MQVNSFFGLLGSIVLVTLVTTIVAHPESKLIATAFGDAFTGSLRAAQGMA